MARTYRGRGRRSPQTDRSSGSGRGKQGAGSSKPPGFQPGAEDSIMVNGYSESWLDKGFPWVYEDEVLNRTRSFAPGDFGRIVSRDGRCLGAGFWDEGKIAVRRFRSDDGPVDADFIEAQMATALARRRLGQGTTAWRWVHGENDDLPGIRVDVWGDVVTITLDTSSLDVLVPSVIDAIRKQHDVRAIWRSWRPAEGEEAADSTLVWGADDEEPVTVSELGLNFVVQPSWGLDAGLYPDMRVVRNWLSTHWEGQRVLNLFAYTGAFSVTAAAHGSSEVVSVDLSAPAIARLRRNFEVNDLEEDGHVFLAEDAFKVLDRYRRKSEEFDIIVADPPSFSHSSEGTWKSTSDLPRLISACLRVLRPGGLLLVASNQGSVSPKEFQKMVKAGADKASRTVRIVHQGTPGHDFPAALSFPEARYLKAWVLQG